MKRLFVPVLLVLSVAWGCAALPIQGEIDSVDHGPYPHDYEAIIKAYYRGVLINPYWAQYEFSQPMAVCYKEEPLEGGRLLGGYLVVVKVNAKNRMGEYVWNKTEGFFLKAGRIIKQFDEHELQDLGF